MQLKCPECGCVGSFATFCSDTAAFEFAELMGRLPPSVARQMRAYVGLFRPKKQGLRWERASDIARGIVQIAESQSISADGKKYAVTHEQIANVLNYTLERRSTLNLPLKDHGYITATLAKQAAASAAEAAVAAEAAENEQRAIASQSRVGGEARQIGSIAVRPADLVSEQVVRDYAAEMQRRRDAGEPQLSMADARSWQRNRRAQIEGEKCAT